MRRVWWLGIQILRLDETLLLKAAIMLTVNEIQFFSTGVKSRKLFKIKSKRFLNFKALKSQICYESNQFSKSATFMRLLVKAKKCFNKCSSINDVPQIWIIFDTHRYTFHYQGFSTVVTKSLTPPPPRAVTSFAFHFVFLLTSGRIKTLLLFKLWKVITAFKKPTNKQHIVRL